MKENLLTEIVNYGFAVVDNIFSEDQIEGLLEVIEAVDTDKPTFRKTTDLFAIRQFLKEVPASIDSHRIQQNKIAGRIELVGES